MALNDEDKKYVKKTVDDSLDNKFKEIEKSAFKKENTTNPNEHKNKYVEKLKKEDQEKEDLHELLLELRERDKKGQNTIAQKVEMLNLTMKEAIPEDFRDAIKETGANIKKGASQSLQGLESLTGRVMNTNPLTAFLWANRGIVGDVWNIGAGAVNAGLGAVKGVAKGAAGLVNASINMFKKKKNKKQEKTEELTTSETILNEETSNELEKEEDYDQSTARKIDELHALFFKGDLFGKKDKEEKERQNILQKGLSGLGKGMKAVNAIIETIAAKQKQILGGLMLGALGILALIGWFKGGGLEKLMKGLLNNPVADAIDESFDNQNDTQASSYKMDAEGSALSGMTGETQQKIFEKKPELLSGIASTDTIKTKTLQGEANTQMNFKVGELTPVLAPYDGGVSKLNKQTNMSQGKAVNVRWVMIITPKDTKTYPILKLRNITSPQVKPNDTFKKGDIIAYATENFSMENEYGFDDSKMDTLQGYQKDVNEAKSTNYKQNYENLAKTKTKEKTKELSDFRYKKDQASYNKQKGGPIEAAKEGRLWGWAGETLHDVTHKKEEDIGHNRWEAEDLASQNKILDWVNNSNKQIDTTVTEEPQKIPTPPKQVDQSSNAEDKMKQQDNTRKEVEAKKLEDDKQNQQLSQGKENNKVASISIAPKAKDNDQYSDMMYIGQFNASNNSYLQTC